MLSYFDLTFNIQNKLYNRCPLEGATTVQHAYCKKNKQLPLRWTHINFASVFTCQD